MTCAIFVILRWTHCNRQDDINDGCSKPSLPFIRGLGNKNCVRRSFGKFNRHTTRMKIRGSVVSSSFIFPHPPEGIKKINNSCMYILFKKMYIYVAFTANISGGLTFIFSLLLPSCRGGPKKKSPAQPLPSPLCPCPHPLGDRREKIRLILFFL